MSIKLITLIVLVITSVRANAFDAEQAKLINEYNSKYESVLKEQGLWPNEQEEFNSKISEAQLSYDTSISELNAVKESVLFLSQDVETQVGHLEFLNQLTLVSEKNKDKIKEAVVRARIFTSANQVNVNSLSAKSNELQIQIDDFDEQIEEREELIRRQEDTPRYRNLIGIKSRLENEMSTVNAGISNAQSEKSILDSRISSLKTSIETSRQREDDFKIEAIRIRTQMLPPLQAEELRESSRLTQLQQDLSSEISKRDLLNEELRELNSRIRNIENRLAQDPDDDELKRRLVRVTQNRNEKRRERNSLNDTISRADRDIDRLKSTIERLKRDIDSKLELALQNDAQAGEESIKQIQFSSQLNIANSDLTTVTSRLSSLEAQQINLTSQQAQNQTDINNYRRTNIFPIEREIGIINGQKTRVVRVQNQILNWAQGLERENINISLIPDRISAHEQIVASVQSEFEEAQTKLPALELNSKRLLLALNASKSAYNQRVTAINTLYTELKDLEEKMKTELSGGNNE